MGCFKNKRTRDCDYEEPLQFDPDFKGPLSKRGCTDVLCFLIFVAFIGVWIAISVYAYKTGNLDNLKQTIDTDGRRCGKDPGVEDKPYLLFFDLTKCAKPETPLIGCSTTQVCVRTCPQENFSYKIEKLRQGRNVDSLRSKMICKKGTKLNTMDDLDSAIQKEMCAPWYLKSNPVFNRCLYNVAPNDLNWENSKTLEKLQDRMAVVFSWVGLVAQNTLSYITNSGNREKVNQVGTYIAEDLSNSKWHIVIGLVCSMFVCLIFIVMMRWIATIMVWLSIFGVIGLLGFSTYYCTKRYIEAKNDVIMEDRIYTNAKDFTDDLLAKKSTWMVFLIASAVCFLVVFLLVIFLRKRICIAVALIREGSKAVGCIPSSLIFPIFPWIFQAGIIVFAVTQGVYLSSIVESEYRFQQHDPNSHCLYYKHNEICDLDTFKLNCAEFPHDQCLRTSNKNPGHVKFYQAVNFVGFFWGTFFISALGEIILAMAFATWYWSFKKRDVPFFTLLNSVGLVFRYHLGTVAFGSLIIAICRMIRVFLEYLDRKLRKFDNGFVRTILCMFKCCFWCLEKFIKFINRNAYIMCAIHGTNFCASAKDAFSLLMRNVVRVFVLDKVTDFLFFMSKLLICLGIGTSAYFIFGEYGSKLFKNELHYAMVPAFVIALGAYFISCLFFGVYAMAVDTLFLCFLEDSERNDGSPQKPYFMSKELMKILGKKNKAE